MIEFIEKNRTYIGIILIIIILIGAGILLWGKKETNSETEISNTIRVDIEGAVKNPGVYELKSGAILEDLIQKCGGISKKADKMKIAQEINRARLLVDGEKIFIPLKGAVAGTGTEAGSSQTTISNSQSVSGNININTATLEQLDTLPGIGPAYAGRIVDYRESQGGFKSIEEIMEVSGIGEKTFEKIKDQITI